MRPQDFGLIEIETESFIEPFQTHGEAAINIMRKLMCFFTWYAFKPIVGDSKNKIRNL